MPEGLNPNHLAAGAESAAKDINSEIFETHGPIWNHRIEIVKLLITLCSAILIGTIGFSGSILNSVSGAMRCSTLLITSWVLIFLSLTFSLVCMWSHMNILSFFPRFVNSGPELKEEFAKVDPASTTLPDDLLSIVDKVTDRSLKPVDSADSLSKLMLNISMLFFIAGLAVFLVFGSIQLNKKPNPTLNSDPACTGHCSLS